MSNVVYLDNVRADRYISDMLNQFLNSPPQDLFEVGKVVAHIDIYTKALNIKNDDRVDALKRYIALFYKNYMAKKEAAK